MPSLLRCEIGDSLLDLQGRKLARHRLEVRRRHASPSMPLKCGALFAPRQTSAQARDASKFEAGTWTKLAAELESDEALLNALLELDVNEPIDALPLALKLRSWPTQSDSRRRIVASRRAY